MWKAEEGRVKRSGQCKYKVMLSGGNVNQSHAILQVSVQEDGMPP